MSTPHKHAALIKAWADGAEIEALDPVTKSWYVVRSPYWTESAQYRARLKPTNPINWEKEREAFARGERIQWRSTCKQHAGMGWLDVDPKSTVMGPAFDEPTNEFRIPHKWQAERDAFARGEAIQCRRNGIGAGWMNTMHPAWDDEWEYRIKPETTKVRVRPALMVSEKSIDPVWVRLAKSTELANELERSPHFRCWVSDWIDVWMPDEDRLTAGNLDASRLSVTTAKISEGSITTEKTALGALHAVGVDAAKPGSDRSVVWYSIGEWPPAGGFSWGIR